MFFFVNYYNHHPDFFAEQKLCINEILRYFFILYNMDPFKVKPFLFLYLLLLFFFIVLLILNLVPLKINYTCKKIVIKINARVFFC